LSPVPSCAPEGFKSMSTHMLAQKPLARSDVKLFSFVEELADPLQKVVVKAWDARGKLMNDIVTYSTLLGRTTFSVPRRSFSVVSDPKLWAFLLDQEDKEALAVVLVGTGGGLCLASGGAVVGVTVGGTIGSAIGVIPAIFTLGLSIPAGAIVGGGGGVVLGSLVGGSAGFVAGGTCGYSVAYLRTDIRRCALCVNARCHDVYSTIVVKPVTKVRTTSRAVGKKLSNAREETKKKTQKTVEGLKEFVSDRRVQASTAGAGIGAATLGTAGATAGTAIGVVGGAMVGLLPALFTFGLSIPIGAMIGGGTGLCIGATAGTATGFVGGGAAGGAIYSYRNKPLKVMTSTTDKVMTSTTDKACEAPQLSSKTTPGSTGGVASDSSD